MFRPALGSPLAGLKTVYSTGGDQVNSSNAPLFHSHMEAVVKLECKAREDASEMAKANSITP